MAYLTAKSNGLEDEAQEILEASGMTEESDLPQPKGDAFALPSVVTASHEYNWPIISVSYDLDMG